MEHGHRTGRSLPPHPGIKQLSGLFGACHEPFEANYRPSRQVKIWQPLDGNFTKWNPVADFKLAEAATAVAFAPSDASDECVHFVPFIECTDVLMRRMLAVGLETGSILLFTSTDGMDWKMSLEIDAGYVA